MKTMIPAEKISSLRDAKKEETPVITSKDAPKDATTQVIKKKKKKSPTPAINPKSPALNQKKQEELDKLNAANAKANSERELLYNYPANLSSKEKKDFRRKARAKIKSLNKTALTLKKDKSPDREKEIAKADKERQAWMKANLTQKGIKEKV